MKTRFSSNMTPEQIIEWGKTQKGNQLDLDGVSLRYLGEKKLKALNQVHRSLNLKRLNLNEAFISLWTHWEWERISEAFQHSVESLCFSTNFLKENHSPDMETAWQRMGVKSIHLKRSDYDQPLSAKTWMTFIRSLKKANIHSLFLNDRFYTLPNESWLAFCRAMFISDLTEITVLDSECTYHYRQYQLPLIARKNQYQKNPEAKRPDAIFNIEYTPEQLMMWAEDKLSKSHKLSLNDLSTYQLSDDQWRGLAALYQRFQVKCLELEGSLIKRHDAYKILDKLYLFESIDILSLEANLLGNHFVWQKIHAICLCGSVKILNLVFNELHLLSDQAWIDLIKGLTEIKVLHLAHNSLDLLLPERWNLFCQLIEDSKIELIDIAKKGCTELPEERRETLSAILEKNKIINSNAISQSSATLFSKSKVPAQNQSTLASSIRLER